VWGGGTEFSDLTDGAQTVDLMLSLEKKRSRDSVRQREVDGSRSGKALEDARTRIPSCQTALVFEKLSRAP